MTTTRWSVVAVAMGLAMAGCATAQTAQKETAPQASKAAVASAQGPWLGTWKRQSAAPSSGTTLFKMHPEADGFRFAVEMIPEAGGEPRVMGGFAKFDGQPYPEKGNPMAEFITFTRIDDHSYGVVDLVGGKETIRFKVTISADGKTRTSVSTSKNAKGETVTSTGVWDRVE